MNKILLIGESCIDRFIYSKCNRLNPEAPSPIINKLYERTFYGMAANVLKNIEALGLQADFITNENNKKLIKTRFVDDKSNYILLRVDEEKTIEPLQNIKNIDFSVYDLIIISDYNKGFLNKQNLEFIFKKSNLSFIDTKKPIERWMKGASFIKINETEYNNPLNDAKFIAQCNNIIVTLGNRGAKYQNKIYSPLKNIKVRDVVGAGDTFLAAIACHYVLNKNIDDAIDFANKCAGEVVTQRAIAYPKTKLL